MSIFNGCVEIAEDFEGGGIFLASMLVYWKSNPHNPLLKRNGSNPEVLRITGANAYKNTRFNCQKKP